MSSKHAMETFGLTKDRYNKAIHALIKKDFYSLMLLSYNLNNQVDDEVRGWTVRNGKLFYNRNSKAA